MLNHLEKGTHSADSFKQIMFYISYPWICQPMCQSLQVYNQEQILGKRWSGPSGWALGKLKSSQLIPIVSKNSVMLNCLLTLKLKVSNNNY